MTFDAKTIAAMLLDMRATAGRLRLMITNRRHGSPVTYGLTVFMNDLDDLIFQFQHRPMAHELAELGRVTLTEANRFIHLTLMRSPRQ